MQEVLIDSCGWKAVVDAGINIDIELQNLVGRFTLLIVDEVRSELERLAEGNRGLLLDILFSKSKAIEVEVESNHVDDILLETAITRGCAVLTVDRELKRRCIESSCRVVEVVSNKRLRLASD